jgi:DNA-binding transcriptional ArsR family regulator
MSSPNPSESLAWSSCELVMEELRSVQPPYAENGTYGGVGGLSGAIPATRPDQVFLGRGAGSLGGWSAKELRSAILETFELRANQYSLSAIRYDLRKLRAHGLIERLPHTHRYRLTAKGQRVAILMTLLRKRLYGPLAASAFVHKPAAQPLPPTPIEKAYRKADRAFQEVIDLMAA